MRKHRKTIQLIGYIGWVKQQDIWTKLSNSKDWPNGLYRTVEEGLAAGAQKLTPCYSRG